VRVVADSHAIYWYLTSPGELSARALEALGEAEETGGIVVSSWTVPELWMAATRKHGSRSIPRASYELVRATLLDSANAVDIEAFGPAMWPHFEAASVAIADPFDAAIVATARALGVDLVSYDRALSAAGIVTVIW
jgi:PIN domain nuclease of toxin-antitoxin system